MVCARAGLDPRGAELLRVTANAVFRLRAEPVVVRIAAPQSQLPRVCRMVRVARWLAEVDFPSVRLHGDLPQPVEFGEYLATFWTYLPQSGAPPLAESLAPPLRELHRLAPPFVLPRWDPIADARRFLAAANGLVEEDRAFLERWCDELAAELAAVTYDLPAGLIHGDAWPGNLLSSSGGVVLCDLDQVSTGPREWDLVPVIVNALRFGHSPAAARRFLERYGFDVTAWPGFPVLRRVRELTVLTGVVPVLSSSPSIAREFARRIDGLRRGREERWRPYR
ncbi:MAG: phosphotransferase [Streptosporangiales bacterium]|nr:phosphotransferase [Streptosporangiales bacterium]